MREVPLSYAQRFSVKVEGSDILLHVLDEKGNLVRQYLISPYPERCVDSLTCFTPSLRRVVMMASPYMAVSEVLDVLPSVKAVSSLRSLYNENLTKMYKSGKIINLGAFNQANDEQLVALRPDGLFISYNANVYDREDQMEALGIPSIYVTSHKEDHPLGKAEWIKFFGIFFDRQTQADSVFDHIERAYSKIKRQHQPRKNKPKVLAGYYKKGSWVAPGGKSYFATLLKDAGADYLFKQDSSRGNITLSFETVYERAMDADYLFFLGMGKVNWDLAQSTEPLLNDWPSVTRQHVYSNDAWMNAHGGNNYWSRGFMEPHVILQDLATILTSQETGVDQLVYFKEAVK